MGYFMKVNNTLKWRKVRTQYVGGDTYVAEGFPELQIIGRPTDIKKNLWLVICNGQVLARGYDLKILQQYCEQHIHF